MTLSETFEKLRARHVDTPIQQRLPTESDVDAVEAVLGVSLPSDLRLFLLEVSNVSVGNIEPATLDQLDSHTYILNIIESARRYGVPDNLLPFCEDNADFFCFNERDEVEYWSHNGVTDERWPNLAAWIEDVWLGASEHCSTFNA